MILNSSRLRVTQAKFFGQPQLSGSVTQLSEGAGINLTPNVINAIGTVAIAADQTLVARNQTKWARAVSFATGGNGTSGSPWTSPSGTGGIQEAYASLPAGVLGTVYAEAGYYQITSPINFSANLGSGIGSAAGTAGVIFRGDGSTNTILNGATKGQGGYGATIGPVFDCTGASHVQLRDFAIITQGGNKSSVGILFARSTAAFARFTEDNEVKNVYMELLHDATANNGNGTIGIYGRATEQTYSINTGIVADHPFVFTSNDVYSISSPNQPVNNADGGTTDNGIYGGFADGYYDSIVLQGAHNFFLSNLICGKAAGSASTHAIRVLADSVTPSLPLLNINIASTQVETWTGVLSTTAPIYGMTLGATYGQDSIGTNPGILLAGANASLKNCRIHLTSGDNATVQSLIGDGGAPSGGVSSCVINLPAPLMINAPNTIANGNHIISEASAPSLAWSGAAEGTIVHSPDFISVGHVKVTDLTGLPTATGGGFLYIRPSVGTPTVARIYVGDGSGWQIDYAKRTASTDTVLFSMLDSGRFGVGTAVPTSPLQVVTLPTYANNAAAVAAGLTAGAFFKVNTGGEYSVHVVV